MPELDLRAFWFAVALHLWQSTLVLLAVFLLASLLRRAPARARHLLWSLALFKFFLPLQLFGGAMRGMLDAFIPGSVSGSASNLAALVSPAILVVHPDSPSPLWKDPFALISLVWLAGAVGMSALWLRAMARQRKGRRSLLAADAPPPGLAPALVGSGIPPERITLLRGRAMPFVAGLFRPRIFLPAMLVERLDSVELQSILLHEDAHRRRRDPLLGLLQYLALTVFFFHPLLWLLRGRLHFTRELACDEQALGRGIPREVCARALARTIHLCLPGLSEAPAAACNNPSVFGRRVHEILEYGSRSLGLRHVAVVALACVVVVLASFSPFQPSIASGPAESGLAESEAVEPQTVEPEVVEPEPDTPDAAPDGIPAGTATVYAEGRQGVRIVGVDGVTVPKLIAETYVKPQYPARAREQRIEGWVILQAVIEKDGSVDDLEILSCTRPGFGFEEASKTAIKHWRYEPATKDGEPVAAYFSIKVDFKLQ